jgi:hypothetical protein
MKTTITSVSQQAKAILEIGRLFAGSLPEEQQARKASEILDSCCKSGSLLEEDAILDAAEGVSELLRSAMRPRERKAAIERLCASVGESRAAIPEPQLTRTEQLLDTALLLQEGESAPGITPEEREFYANLQFGWDEEKGFYLVPDSDTLAN